MKITNVSFAAIFGAILCSTPSYAFFTAEMAVIRDIFRSSYSPVEIERENIWICESAAVFGTTTFLLLFSHDSNGNFVISKKTGGTSQTWATINLTGDFLWGARISDSSFAYFKMNDDLRLVY